MPAIAKLFNVGSATLIAVIIAVLLPAPTAAQIISFCDVSQSNLPHGVLNGLSMDAATGDFDGDGDLDLVIASEFKPNILLLNDGNGVFENLTLRHLPQNDRDSEDIAVADFDRDGDLDIIVASEDDRVDEYYVNDGGAFFGGVPNGTSARGRSNSVTAVDVDNDGDIDLVLGNNGQNSLLINNGSGRFIDESLKRLPPFGNVTQDIDAGDIDNDGDIDLVVANEGRNRLLINDGNGAFSEESGVRIPRSPGRRETREIDLGDVDGDGDLDIVTANVRFFVDNAILENSIFINKGGGFFSDETDSRLPQHDDQTVDIDFVDIDRDGDLDIITANTNALRIGSEFRVFVNNGRGFFNEVTDRVFPTTPAGVGFDIEAADFNGDKLVDFYFAVRGSEDVLVLQSLEKCL